MDLCPVAGEGPDAVDRRARDEISLLVRCEDVTSRRDPGVGHAQAVRKGRNAQPARADPEDGTTVPRHLAVSRFPRINEAGPGDHERAVVMHLQRGRVIARMQCLAEGIGSAGIHIEESVPIDVIQPGDLIAAQHEDTALRVDGNGHRLVDPEGHAAPGGGLALDVFDAPHIAVERG